MGFEQVLLLGLLGHVRSNDIMDCNPSVLVCQLFLKKHQLCNHLNCTYIKLADDDKLCAL